MRIFRLAVVCGVVACVLNAQQPAAAPAKDESKSGPTTAPVHRETVVVTGTYEPLPPDEADRSVSVETLPARVLLFGSLSDLLRLDSSVDVEARAPGGVTGDISIRGGTAGQTLVLLNGVRLNDVQTAHHDMDFPAPIDAVQQVEVLQGAGSTLYGSDAVAGVVNIITRVAPGPEMVIRGGAGNYGTNEESGFLSFGSERVSQQFSFERELSTGFMDDRDYRNLAGSSETHVRTALGTTSVFLAGLDRPFGANQFYGNFNSWERTKTWFSSLHQDLGKKTDFTLAYRRHTDLFVLFRDQPQIYTNRHIDESWDIALRRHEDLGTGNRLFYGAEGTADRITSNNLGDHHRRQGAVYADFDTRAVRRFSFSAGAREEFYGHHQTVFTPTLSAGVWLSAKVKLRASASRAFRLPNYTDLYYSDPANVGNPNLKPEQATDYEGGIDWHPAARWRVTATVFERREKNDIDYVRASPADVWRATNFDQLNFIGVEGQLEGQLPHGQQITVGYTALHGAQAVLGTEQSKYVFNYPTNEAVASWQMLMARGVLVRTKVGVTNRFARTPYGLWDVYAAWTRHRVRPYARMTNLTATNYQEIYGVAMPGRAVLAGVEVCVLCGGH